MNFKPNMGNIDRGARIIIAIVLAIIVATGTVSGVWAWILGIFAIVFLATSFISFCPLYVPLKFSTKGK